MGQCVTVSTGNDSAVLPVPQQQPAEVIKPYFKKRHDADKDDKDDKDDKEDDEDDEEEGICGCIEEASCFGCI